MSWFSIPLPNPFFKVDEEEEEEEEKVLECENRGHEGVKEDLPEVSKTLTRQLFGISSFLSPNESSSSSSSKGLIGIRKDFAEIGGSFKKEISKIASAFLQYQSVDDDDAVPEDYTDSGGRVEISKDSYVVGVTEEVLEFARDLSTRPESWLDFPLPFGDDFDMSVAQRDHASTVEHLAPSLAELKVRLCPSHMSEGCFWKIYYVMLHPKLNENDSELLSTPQIVEARQEMQNRINTQLQSSESDYLSLEINVKGSNIQEENIEVQEKGALSETLTTASHTISDVHDITDQWLEEDGGIDKKVDTRKQLGNEDDVSFSDLEDEDDDDDEGLSRDKRSRSGQDAQDSSPRGSNEWVQLSKNYDIHGSRNKGIQPTPQEKCSDAESSDWLNIDDFD
ncbi:uncharacterized protein LOC143851559 [Tasmannia lanceolata]|uniref:uncharacterized protein LOC143851559 n=1 Tax=Tasmannia lanceolata TaxID=3420 RepID=UPI004063E75D